MITPLFTCARFDSPPPPPQIYDLNCHSGNQIRRAVSIPADADFTLSFSMSQLHSGPDAFAAYIGLLTPAGDIIALAGLRDGSTVSSAVYYMGIAASGCPSFGSQTSNDVAASSAAVGSNLRGDFVIERKAGQLRVSGVVAGASAAAGPVANTAAVGFVAIILARVWDVGGTTFSFGTAMFDQVELRYTLPTPSPTPPPSHAPTSPPTSPPTLPPTLSPTLAPTPNATTSLDKATKSSGGGGGGGSSAGLVAGVVAGILVLLAVAAVIVFVVVRRRKSASHPMLIVGQVDSGDGAATVAMHDNPLFSGAHPTQQHSPPFIEQNDDYCEPQTRGKSGVVANQGYDAATGALEDNYDDVSPRPQPPRALANNSYDAPSSRAVVGSPGVRGLGPLDGTVIPNEAYYASPNGALAGAASAYDTLRSVRDGTGAGPGGTGGLASDMVLTPPSSYYHQPADAYARAGRGGSGSAGGGGNANFTESDTDVDMDGAAGLPNVPGSDVYDAPLSPETQWNGGHYSIRSSE